MSLTVGQRIPIDLPSGAIVWWSGASGTVPEGWHICNGNEGTPNLNDRFIVGAGGSYAVGASGGEDSVTLSTTTMATHKHTNPSTGSDGGHKHTLSSTTGDGAHKHTVPETALEAFSHNHSFTGSSWKQGDSAYSGTNRHSTTSSHDTGSDGSHTHPITFNTVSTHTHTTPNTGTRAAHKHTLSGTGSTGGGQSHENRPPFLALFLIMKL